jgi:hypothetical protein
MKDLVAERVAARGITRVCHFTPSRSLAHILANRSGIRPSRELSEEERQVFNPTDLKRLDNHTSHICCSIEYPNGWYMAKAQSAESLFPDWVVLFVRPTVLSLPDTLFCPRNAAAGGGRYLDRGVDGFDAMYPLSGTGAYGKMFRRGATHLRCSPTDDQAEVLVPLRIPVEDIIGIAVRTADQGVEERIRLGYCGIDHAGLNFVVAPDLFQKHALSRAIRDGVRPKESPLAP